MNAIEGNFPVAPIPQPATPPYALATPSFRFRALASLAGRAPLGGAREVVLATFLVARLVDDCQPRKALPSSTRAARSAAARSWLATMALPTSVRAALTKLAETTEGDLPDLASALTAVIAVTSSYLDDPARLELDRLARAIVP